jgi:hypothetical protein
MKISIKIAVVMIGLASLISSCQKDDMPMPGSCNKPQQTEQTPDNARVGGPQTTNDGGNVGSGHNDPTADTIVGHGDDDRDGGGIVGGGDDDKDGGRIKNDEQKPR